MIGVFDCEKQEQVFREMTDEEYANYLLDVEVIKQSHLLSGDTLGND